MRFGWPRVVAVRYNKRFYVDEFYVDVGYME